MLKSLHIHNLILIETAEIPFESGFNVITGETGSGKSALLHALSLVMGERSDFSILRHGAEKGYVEATFDVASYQTLLQDLETAGIEHEADDFLIIKRELTATGKSRILINHQIVQQTLLRKIGMQLVTIINQHDNQTLFDLHEQRKMVDAFGGITPLLATFQDLYTQHQTLTSALRTLRQSEAERIREIEIAQVEMEEIDQARIQKGEEEELFAEFSRLSSAEERASYVEQVLQGHHTALGALTKSKIALEKLHALDPDLDTTLQAFSSAFLDLEEITHTLRRYPAIHDPLRLAELDQRLALLNKLKRKYGDPLAYREERATRLHQLLNADHQIEELSTSLRSLQTELDHAALCLTEARLETTKQLGRALTAELHTLHMPQATCTVELLRETRTQMGDERVEIFLQPNLGEQATPARETASGGELARLLLALHTLLAGKRALPTLVFDEIDANIGGTTATLIGAKLRAIALRHQILCISHFAQVAAAADHHLQIQKHEYEGRTHTLIFDLSPAEREKELARMRGELAVT